MGRKDRLLPVMTISRQMCSYGDDIAEALSRRLGWDLITRVDLFDRFPDIATTAYDKNMLAESAKYFLAPCRGRDTFLDCLKDELIAYTGKNPAVLVGFGSQIIYAGRTDALHIRIIAPKETRIARAKKQYRVSDEEAGRILDTADRRHRRFVSTVFGADIADPTLYDLTLNTSVLKALECADTILTLYEARSKARELELLSQKPDAGDRITGHPTLKNQSEAEFARLLDMYQIDWMYEPKTFPIEWDAEGNVTMAFSPDFYLTKFNTYIELTTMDQRYVTTKNKKVKKLRELYPGTNIKVVYKKDFYSLVERFNTLNGAL
jgi:cytidylate kinase